MPPDAIAERPAPPNHVQLTIDGTPLTVPQGTTIFDADAKAIIAAST